jgi:molybdopterin-binding protein
MNTSIRNRLPGTIEQIVSDKVVSEIVINTAAGPVTSIITIELSQANEPQRGRQRFRHSQSDRSAR